MQIKNYTVAEVADHFRCSRGHVYNLARRGLITLRKCGNRTIVLREDVDRLQQSMPVLQLSRLSADAKSRA